MDVLIIDKSDQLKPVLTRLDANVVTLSDEVKALSLVENKWPTVVFLSYEVMQEKTSDYIKVLLKLSSSCKIIVIANELSENEILNCLLAGAKGYQALKQLNEYGQKLITVVAAGEAWITRRMTAIVLDTLRTS